MGAAVVILFRYRHVHHGRNKEISLGMRPRVTMTG